jgi:hypothetical protein
MTAGQTQFELLNANGQPLAEQFEEFARLIAGRELGDMAFYCIEPIGDAKRFDWPTDLAGGWTFPYGDLACRDFLRSCGRWKGRGYLVMVKNQIGTRKFMSTGIHELCHCVLFAKTVEHFSNFEPEDYPKGSHLRQVEAELEQITMAGPSAPLNAGGRRLWDGHGPGFIRVMIHLVHRAASFGLRLGDGEISCAGKPYGLSPFSQYERALGAEPEVWATRNLKELSGRPMPARFEQLFANDVGLAAYD